MNTIIEIEKENKSKEIINENIKIRYIHKNFHINDFMNFISEQSFKVSKIDIPNRDERNAR